jgi:cytochrome P450
MLLAVLIYVSGTYDKRYRHLPPQVPGWPIINQTLYHLQDDLATDAIKWTREYGEIFRTKSGLTNWIWLNSGEAVKEIIDRKSAIYSSRHRTPLGFESASGGRRVNFMPYGERWRTLRSIIHRLLTPAMTKSYSPAQLYEAKQLSVDLLDSPEGNYPYA